MVIYWKLLNSIHQKVFEKMVENILKTFTPTMTNQFPPISVFWSAYNEVKECGRMQDAYKTWVSLPAPANDDKMSDEEISSFFGNIKQQLTKENV